jgi:uncharacterized protein YbbC (DUF1343 family)
VHDRLELRPVVTGLAVVKTCFDLYGENFRWKEPPYEYVFDKNPFDVISGTDRVRISIERGDSLEDLERSWRAELPEFENVREKYLLY